MFSHDHVSRYEVEYKYRRGVPGRRGGAVTTLRVFVKGKVDNDIAKSVLDAAQAAGCLEQYDDICIVGQPRYMSPAQSRDVLDKILLDPNFLAGSGED